MAAPRRGGRYAAPHARRVGPAGPAARELRADAPRRSEPDQPARLRTRRGRAPGPWPAGLLHRRCRRRDHPARQPGRLRAAGDRAARDARRFEHRHERRPLRPALADADLDRPDCTSAHGASRRRAGSGPCRDGTPRDDGGLHLSQHGYRRYRGGRRAALVPGLPAGRSRGAARPGRASGGQRVRGSAAHRGPGADRPARATCASASGSRRGSTSRTSPSRRVCRRRMSPRSPSPTA